MESVAEAADHDLLWLPPLIVGQLGLGGHRRLVAAGIGPLPVVDDDGVGALAAPVDGGDLALDLDGDELAREALLCSTDIQFDALVLGAAHRLGVDLYGTIVGVVRRGREGDDVFLLDWWSAGSRVLARTGGQGQGGSGHARHQDFLPQTTHNIIIPYKT